MFKKFFIKFMEELDKILTKICNEIRNRRT
jgi:hypothetical protein